MKKILLLTSILIFVGIVFVLNLKIDIFRHTEVSKNIEPEANQESIENIVYTVTLERVEPITEGDEYAWMLVCEPGQLGYSLNALGLSSNNPLKLKELLGEDENTVIYSQKDIDLEKIYKKLNLRYESILLEDKTITITYSQDDVSM